MSERKQFTKNDTSVKQIKIPEVFTKFKASPLNKNVEADNTEVKEVTLSGQNESFEGSRIDLVESGASKQNGSGLDISPKPAALKSLRYYVMLLALFSPFVTTYSRTIINFAITDMIDNSESIETTTTKTTTTAGHGQSNLGAALNVTTEQYFFDLDHSCSVDDEVRARLIEENEHDIQRANSGQGEKYKWDTFKQGLLKAAYAIGHAPFQIPGSRLSEIYGSHAIMSGASILIAICCLAAPYLAALHFYLIFVDLILLGILGSFMTPALITLFSNWLTPGEKTVMFSFYMIASRLGYAMSSFLCGLLIQAQYSWRYVFFSASWFSFFYSIIFFLSARSRPRDHPLIKQVELNYLATKNTLVKESLLEQDQLELSEKNGIIETSGQHKQEAKKSSAPWFAILTNVSVWSFIITKFCVKLAGDTVQIELPSYLKKVMHFSARDNGIINAINYVMFCVCCFMVGNLSKYVMKVRPFGLSKTTIRKCFQCFASFGVTLVLLGVAFSVCNNFYTQFWLILMFFFTTFGIGGEAQIPFDITERYPGTIHAIGSSIAISGAIEPTLVGFLMRGHAADQDSWKTVWIGASIISFIGGTVFLLFADATIQSFDSIGKSKEEERANKELKGKENKAFENDTTLKDRKRDDKITISTITAK